MATFFNLKLMVNFIKKVKYITSLSLLQDLAGPCLKSPSLSLSLFLSHGLDFAASPSLLSLRILRFCYFTRVRQITWLFYFILFFLKTSLNLWTYTFFTNTFSIFKISYISVSNFDFILFYYFLLIKEWNY